MKKKMAKPEMTFIELDGFDVITTSGGMEVGGQESAGGYGDVTDLGGGGIGEPLQ